MPGNYPEQAIDRNLWVRRLRSDRIAVETRKPSGWLIESEVDGSGRLAPGLTIFLSNRECPWRCVFCDLWRHTLARPVAPGDVPAQIDWVLDSEDVQRRRLDWVKLYNAGSFFDAGAIPVFDYQGIAKRVQGFGRVITECHPTLVGDRCWRFRDQLHDAKIGHRAPQLEVAMGLETAHASVLAQLNKRMTLDDFTRAAEALNAHGVAWRAFVLVQPPFEDPTESVAWAVRSAGFAFDLATAVVSLIPVRPGNGALEALQNAGHFTPPTLQTLEAALEGAMLLKRGRVFADLWDLDRFRGCPSCFGLRKARLEEMNRTQLIPAPVRCGDCGS